MSGVSNIEELISSMRAELLSDVYVFATTQDESLASAVSAKMTFREAEGLTLILTREEADGLALKHDFPCRMITLNIHSSLDAIGFMAQITTHLAQLGMGVNPVSAFYHDHLFVPETAAQEALEALHSLANTGSSNQSR